MNSNSDSRRKIGFAALGILPFTVFPAIGNEPIGPLPSSVTECEAAKTRFLESEYPSAADLKTFFDCFHVDFTYGTITRIPPLEPPKQEDACQSETGGLAIECGDLSRG